MFLLLEDNEVILLDNIVVLVRHEGRTTIISRDNSARESAFTPATLDRRSSRLISRQNRNGGRLNPPGLEDMDGG